MKQSFQINFSTLFLITASIILEGCTCCSYKNKSVKKSTEEKITLSGFLNEQLNISAEIINTAKAGDPVILTEAIKIWPPNTNQSSSFLSNIHWVQQ